MLANLFSGSSKTVTNLESKTEEDHSRSLLWPPHLADPLRPFSISPSSTAVVSPTFRPGGYDDRGGLELNELKDVRIIIAQDAFGSLDRPLVLFDSHRHSQPETPNQSHHQEVASSSPTPSPLHSPRKPQANLLNSHQRNRSTTFSGTSSPWSRPAREVESHDKVNRLLDCMFGVTSATKSESSTKMHVLLAGQDPPLIHSQTSPVLPQHQFSARATSSRSNTASQIGPIQKPLRIIKDEDSVNEDIVLVTRMFTATLAESKEAVPKTPKVPPKAPASATTDGKTHADDASPGKRAKLIEKKVPMYAVAIMVQLPPDEAKKSGSRPVSRTSPLSTSFPNSFSSEVASSWTLLETIPDSLSSSAHSQKSTDRRIEHITNNWDVILRSLSHLEVTACVEIERMLNEVNMQLLTSIPKVPKGPYEQRTNQRNVYLRSGFAQEELQKTLKAVRQTQKRICLALRIPKAVTGAGFLGGHWLDEARYLIQVCAVKAQDKFLYSLLSAFLDTHTEWLENMGFDCFRKQGHMHCRPAANAIALASRTVIIADRRSLARRLIFLLASFLPSARGINAFENAAEGLKSPLYNPNLVSLHSRNPDLRQVGAKEIAIRNNRPQHVSFGHADLVLSTSASSDTSIASRRSYRRSRPHLTHRDSDTSSIRRLTRAANPQSGTHSRKASSTDPTITPLPATSMPFISSRRAGNVEEEAIDEGGDIKASVGLQNILRRESSSLTSSSSGNAWGTLFGGLWTKKNEDTHALASSGSTIDEADLRRRIRIPSDSSTSNLGTEGSKLDSMVREATGVPVPRKEGKLGLQSRSEEIKSAMSHEAIGVEPPRLRVNEDDGVVDVDVGIPGFLGWDREDGPISPSKPSGGASSLRSLDGAASLHSSVSHGISRGQPTQSDDPNVAGYLKRYHEDFALQAVAYYDDLPKEIMDSMSREPKPIPFSHQSPSDRDQRRQGPDDGWVTVSSTLVVDTRRFSLERLHLMRRQTLRSQSSGETARSPQNRSHGRQANYEEAFFLETIDRPDSIIATATEAMLDQTRPPLVSAASRSATPSGSGSGSGSGRLPGMPPLSTVSSQYQHSPFSDCWYAIANALNEVVIRGRDDLRRHPECPKLTTSITVRHGDRPVRLLRQRENVLRDGVKRWLMDAEPVG